MALAHAPKYGLHPLHSPSQGQAGGWGPALQTSRPEKVKTVQATHPLPALPAADMLQPCQHSPQGMC